MDHIKPFLAGCIAGGAEFFVEYPGDTVKANMQIKNFKNVWGCGKSIYSNYGIKGFYFGATTRIFSCIASASILFGTNEFFKKSFGAEKNKINASFIGAAFLTGCVEASIYTPIDLIKSRMQLQIDGRKSFSNYFKIIYNQYGIKGFYKGLWMPTLWKEGIGNAFYFSTYEVVSNTLKDYGVNKWISSIIGGGMAGSAYWVVLPIDTIRTMKQTNNKLAPRNVNSLYSMMNIYKKYGVSRLYTGLTPVLIRAWPANMVLFSCYELMKDVFKI